MIKRSPGDVGVGANPNYPRARQGYSKKPQKLSPRPQITNYVNRN